MSEPQPNDAPKPDPKAVIDAARASLPAEIQKIVDNFMVDKTFQAVTAMRDEIAKDVFKAPAAKPDDKE